MIRGLPNGTPALAMQERMDDWTFGCVALSDAGMKEVYDLVPNGTPIDIAP